MSTTADPDNANPVAPAPAWPGRRRLWIEFALLFVGLPGVLVALRHSLINLVIPLMWVAAAVCLLLVRRDPAFPRGDLLRRAAFWAHMWRTLRVFLPLAALLTVYTYHFEPQLFMQFPRGAPLVWLVVMMAYPLVSAYPQELVYRVFFLHRYKPLFGSGQVMLWVSAAAFGWAHAFLGTWVAVVLPAIGGVLFARTYMRSGSALQSTLEHGLWGDFLFTVGLGWYLYAGSIGG